MKKLYTAIILTIFCLTTRAQSPSQTEVLLLGTFHFDNPGLDVAKFKSIDIMSPVRQQEIAYVVDQIKKFRPDKIFIELEPRSQQKVDSLLNLYKADKFTLTSNERHQLAFRLAKELQLPTLYCIDYKEAAFPFDSLMKSAVAAGQMSFVSDIQNVVQTIQNDFNAKLEKMTIGELLLDANTEKSNSQQVELYYGLLPAGKQGNHIGPYLVSEWWRRNMVIYENILKSLNGSEKKIMVLFGSGHTALLYEMMKHNKSFKLVPASDVIRK